MNIKKPIKYLSIIIIILLSISGVLSIFMPFLQALRIVFGSVYVLFLPGFILTYIFFPKTKELSFKHKEEGRIDWIERIALSFALSIAIVPLVVFYLNKIGIKINFLNSFLTISFIIIISIIILIYRNKRK